MTVTLVFATSITAAEEQATGKNKAEQTILDFVTAFNRQSVDGQFEGQCAYAMYHLSDGLVQSVWYFSAHPCDTQ